MTMASLPATALATRQLSPSLIPVRSGVGSAAAREAGSTSIPVGIISGSHRANQEVNILDLLGGGSGGSGAMEGGDGINLILEGLYRNNVDVDVDVVGIIDQCLVTGNGNMDINCFIGKLDDQIADFDVKEMAEQMGVGTEPYVQPPALDCPSGEAEVKSFQIPPTGERCVVCIPFLATTICGYSCSCSNGNCGCSMKPPDCPGTLICAGSNGNNQEEESVPPSGAPVGDDASNENGAKDALNEIPEDAVALEGDVSTQLETPSNSPTAYFGEGEDSAQQDQVVLSEGGANETKEATALPDQTETVPSSPLPRNDKNDSSARKHAGPGTFVSLVGLLAASATIFL